MKLSLDKYYTQDSLAEYCINKTYEALGNTWDRIIEPSAGSGSYLKYLPECTLAYDIKPEMTKIIEQDYLELELPYIKNTLIIGNPPFGRANKLSVKFIKKSLEFGDYISFIQPISQLNNDRIAGVDLIYSEDLGPLEYSGKKVHCCLNIYKANKDHKRNAYNIPGVTCRHIFRTGSEKHSQELLDKQWDFRIAAWGVPRLLNDGEYCTNEVVIECLPEYKEKIEKLLKDCNYQSLLSCVSLPNLPAWRVKKYLWERW